jgi:hypothetical protein
MLIKPEEGTQNTEEFQKHRRFLTKTEEFTQNVTMFTK